MQFISAIVVLLGTWILLKTPGTTASSHHRSYQKSTAAKAARDAVANPDSIERKANLLMFWANQQLRKYIVPTFAVIHARNYDPSKPLVSSDPEDMAFRLYSDPQ